MMASSVDSSLSRCVWKVAIVNVEKEEDWIIVTGTTFYPAEARARTEAIHGLLLACNLDRSSPDVSYQNLVLARVSTNAGCRVFRATVTDWCPTQHGIVKVFLVDEGQVNLPVGLDQLYPCPQHLNEIKVPAIYKRFILADVFPVLGEWSSETISWIKTELEHKTVDAVFRESNQELSYINPLDPRGVPLTVALLAKGKATSENFSGLRMTLPGMHLPHKTATDAEAHPLQSFLYPQKRIAVDSYEKCYVLGIEKGPWRFCLQFEDQRVKLNELDKKLCLLVQLKKLARAYPKEGDTVICPVGKQYCRGLVLKKAYNQEIAVYCVDKGITVCKALDDIWQLPEEFITLPVLAYRCCLHGLPDIEDSDISKKFFGLVINGDLLGQLVMYDEVLTTVSLILNCHSVLRMILPPYYEELILPETCKAIISYIHEEDAIIYLQQIENQSKLEEMQAKLQEQNNGMAKEIRLECGTPCLAIFPEDGLWYRAIIVQAENPLIVQYVDYGNEAAIPADYVKSLDIMMIMDLPAQAIPCVLNDVHIKPLTNDLIDKIVGEANVNVQVVGKMVVHIGKSSRNLPVVELVTCQNGVSVSTQVKQLKQRNADLFHNNKQEIDGKYEKKQAKKERASTMNTALGTFLRPCMINLAPNSRKECKLSWVYTPLRFYLTLLGSEPAIKEMKKIMNEMYDLSPSSKFVEKVKEGWMVAVHGEDNFWHRALVISCCGSKIKLLLIDSGMEKDVYVNQLRVLPDNILTAPSQALECFMEDGNLPDVDEVSCQLKKMVNSNFLVHFINFSGGKWKVEFIHEVPHIPDRHKAVSKSVAPLQSKMSKERTQKSGIPIRKLHKLLDIESINQEPTAIYHSGWRDLNLKSEFGNKSDSSSNWRKQSENESSRSRKQNELGNWRNYNENENDSLKKQSEFSDWRNRNENESKSGNKFQNQLGCGSFSRSKQREDDCWRKQNKVGKKLDFKNNNNGEKPPKPESLVNSKLENSPLAHYGREHALKNCMSYEIDKSNLFSDAIRNIQAELVKGSKSSSREKNELDLKGNNEAKSLNVYEQSKKLNIELELGKKSDDEDCNVCEYSIFRKLTVPLGEIVHVQVTWVLSPLKFYCRLTNSLLTSLQAQMKAAQDECNRLLAGGVPHSFAKSQPVMALHADGMWHRAKIMSVSGHRHTVQYVDMGELRSNLKSNEILPLKKEYIENIPALALRVVISNLKPSGANGWSVEATNITKEKLQRANQCVFKRQCFRNCAYATQVMVNEENYVEHLLNTGVAVKIDNSPAKSLNYGINFNIASSNTMAQLNPVNEKKLSLSPFVDSKDKILSDTSNIEHQHLLHNQDKNFKKNKSGFTEQVPILNGSEVHLSHADNDGTLWLQCRTDLEILYQLEKDLNSCIADCKILNEIALGMACIVKSFKNSKLCRASVKNIKDNEVEVHCVDYGYSESLPHTQAFEIPEELQCISPLSYKCVLNLLDSTDVQNMNWNLLQKISSNQVLNVEVHSFCGEKHVVTITNRGMNILRILSDSFIQNNCTVNEVVGKALRENYICPENSSNDLQWMNNMHRDREEKMTDKIHGEVNTNEHESLLKSHHQSQCFEEEMGFSVLTVTDPLVVEEGESRKLVQEVPNKTIKERYSRSLENFTRQQNWEHKEKENITKEDDTIDCSKNPLIISDACVDLSSQHISQNIPEKGRKSIQTEEKPLREIFYTGSNTGADESLQSVHKAADKVIEQGRLEDELGVDDSKFNQCFKIQKEVLMHGNEQRSLVSEFALGGKEETVKLHDPMLAYSPPELCHKIEEAKKYCHHKVMNMLSTPSIISHESTVAPFGSELIEGLGTEEIEDSTKKATSNAKNEFVDSNNIFSSVEVISEYSDSRESIENNSGNENAQMHFKKCSSEEKTEFNTTATADTLKDEINIGKGSHRKMDTVKKDLHSFVFQSLSEVKHDTISDKQATCNLTCDLRNATYTDSSKRKTEISRCTLSPESQMEKYENFSHIGKRQIRFDILQEKIIVQDFIVPDKGKPLEMIDSLQTAEITYPKENTILGNSYVKDDDIHQSSDIKVVKDTIQDSESFGKDQKEDQQNSEVAQNSYADNSVLVHTYTKDSFADHSQERLVIEHLIKDVLQDSESNSVHKNLETKCVLLDSQVELCEESQSTDMGGESQIQILCRDSYKNVTEHPQNKNAFKDVMMKNVLEDSQEEVVSENVNVNDKLECILVDNVSGGLNTFLDTFSKNSSEDREVEGVIQNSNAMECLDCSKPEHTSKDPIIRDMLEKTQKDVHDESLVMSTCDKTYGKELEYSLIQDMHGDLQLRNLPEILNNTGGEDVYEDILELDVSQDYPFILCGDSKIMNFSGEAQVKNVFGDSEVVDVPIELPVNTVIRLSKMCEDKLFQYVTRDSEVINVNGDSKVIDVTGDLKVTDATGDLEVTDVTGDSKVTNVTGVSKAIDITRGSKITNIIGDSMLIDALHHVPVQDITIGITSKCPIQKFTERVVPFEDTSYTQVTSTEHTDILEACKVKLKPSIRKAARKTNDHLGAEFTGLKPQAPLTLGTAVYISHFEDDHRLWLQRACDVNILHNLSLKINTSLDSVQVPSNLHEGLMCLAQSEDDCFWYRAVILNILESQVFVHFIDYGNYGLISMEQVRDIQEDILIERQLSYECKLKKNSSFQLNTYLTSLLETYLDKELVVASVDTNAPEAFTLTYDTMNILNGYGILEFTSYPITDVQEGYVFSRERFDMYKDERLEMHIEQEHNEETFKRQKGQLHTKEGFNIDLGVPQFTDDESDINRYQMSTKEKPMIYGEQVSSYSEDTECFREPVCDEKELKSDQDHDNASDDPCIALPFGKGTKEKVKVRTPHFANTLNKNISFNNSSEWPNYKKELHEKVNERCKGKKCLQVEDLVFAELDIQMPPDKSGRLKGKEFITYKGDKKFKSSLHAIKEVEESETLDFTEVEVKPYNAFVVNIEESPFSLWIQRQEDINLAEFVDCYLKEFGDDLPLLENPQIDQLCVSLLCGSHHRVQVVGLSGNDATVNYIDHGRSGVVSQKELWELEDELTDIPPLATQIILPVEVISSRKSCAVLAVAEAALHNICACFDLNLLSPSSGMSYTLFSAPGFGDIGELLVNSDLAKPINWEEEIGLHVASTIKRRMEVAANVLHNDQEQHNSI